MVSAWIPPYALGVLVLITGISGPAAGLYGIVRARSNRARVLWSALIPMGSFAALALGYLANGEAALIDLHVGVRDDHLLVPVAHIRALTDQGHVIPLRQAAHPPEPGLFARLQASLPERAGVFERVLLTTPVWQDCNCHGWIFTGGRFFIASEDVPDILTDNGYYPVTDPCPGDLAVYHYGDGHIAHTGLVYNAAGAAGGGKVEVQSKWGIMGGVYRHASHVHPYQTCQCTFYRSPRPGHLLRGLDAADLDAVHQDTDDPDDIDPDDVDRDVVDHKTARQQTAAQETAGRPAHEFP